VAHLIYAEGWLIVVLSLGASFACWRNSLRISNSKRGIRQTKALVCLSMALITASSLLGWLPGLYGLVLLLGALSSLLLSLVAREIIEAPSRKHD